MLDEDALEAMLARGRGASQDPAKMVTTDQNDEFEVYERKDEPKPVAEPVAPPAPKSDDASPDFEVYGEGPITGQSKPEPVFEAEPEPSWEAEPEPAATWTAEPEPTWQPDPIEAAELVEPEPEPVPIAPPAPRRAEVWPPIGRTHATPQPAAAPPAAMPQIAPAPSLSTHRSSGGARVAILQAIFNQELTDMMADLAVKRVGKHGGTVVAHETCPGVYDLPLPCKRLLARDDVDAVVVLGVVVQGETKHDELITHATAKTLQELSLQFDKPVGLGITGPGMTWKQAEQRVVNGAHAVDAVMALTTG